MPKDKLGKTGDAPLVKQGQTTDGKYGSNPDAKAKGARGVRELNP
jgi:hypothetical protein